MKVITISREYGAGGHSVGTAVAGRLGIEFYDKDIIRAAVKASGFDEELVRSIDENESKLQQLLKTICDASSIYYHDSRDVIRDLEKAVILNFARKEPCVILGRCADVILRDAGIDCLNVYLYADVMHRAKRAAELNNETDINVLNRIIAKTDSARSNYYHHYTGKNLGDAKNYHVCLDTGALGYEKCIEIITDLAKD